MEWRAGARARICRLEQLSVDDAARGGFSQQLAAYSRLAMK
jgi:hypothetical protein